MQWIHGEACSAWQCIFCLQLCTGSSTSMVTSPVLCCVLGESLAVVAVQLLLVSVMNTV